MLVDVMVIIFFVERMSDENGTAYRYMSEDHALYYAIDKECNTS